MKYFTIEELTRSDTAEEHGIDNTPTPEEEKKLVALIENVLDPLREMYGGPITVNSGYRGPVLNSCIGGAKTSQHCFDSETEILTERGWATPETIDECDNVYSYNIGTGLIELVPIDSIIKRHHSGKMVRIQSLHTDMMVTDQHRMLVRYDSHKYVRKGGLNITPKGQAYFDSLKTDNDKYHIELIGDIYGRRRNFLCAGVMNGHFEADMPILKMCMAAISDGYFWYRNRSVALGFRFKKERKCKQLEDLLHDLDWYYTKTLDRHGVYNYYLRSYYAVQVYDIIGPNKIIPKWILNIGSDNLRELIKYYSIYDGSRDKRENCESFSIFSSVKENVDMLQSMCAISGMRSQYIKKNAGPYNIKGMTGNSKESYHIIINPNKYETKVKENSFSLVDYNGIVWCVNNRNTTLVTRRKGKISIQGNCKGEAADITGGNKEANKRLFELIREKLHFDQLINEYDYSWVHVSYKSSGNRKEVLKCVNGKYYRL